MSDFNELSEASESYDRLREKAFSIIENSTVEDLHLCLTQYREENDLGSPQALSSGTNESEDAYSKQNLIDVLDSLLDKKLEPMRQELSKNREYVEILSKLLMVYLNTGGKQHKGSMHSESNMYTDDNSTMPRYFSNR